MFTGSTRILLCRVILHRPTYYSQPRTSYQAVCTVAYRSLSFPTRPLIGSRRYEQELETRGLFGGAAHHPRNLRPTPNPNLSLAFEYTFSLYRFKSTGEDSGHGYCTELHGQQPRVVPMPISLLHRHGLLHSRVSSLRLTFRPRLCCR